jgi:hypothetical protein
LNQHISFASINIFDDEMFVPVESKQIYYGQYLYNFVRIRPDSMKKKLDALIQYAKSKGSTSLSLGLFKDIWSSAGVSDISNSLSDQLRRNRNETLSVEDLRFLRQYIENPQEAFHVLHEKLTRARDMARYKKILDILQVSDDKDQFGFLELFEYVIARVFREEGFVRLNIKSGNDFEVFDRISTVEPGDLFPRGKIFTIQNQDVVLRNQN